MTHFRLVLVFGASAALGLLRPRPPGAAAGGATTLAQTPVTGRLADGGTFHGRLTLQALRFDEGGELVAIGVLSGTATPAAGRTTKMPNSPLCHSMRPLKKKAMAFRPAPAEPGRGPAWRCASVEAPARQTPGVPPHTPGR